MPLEPGTGEIFEVIAWTLLNVRLTERHNAVRPEELLFFSLQEMVGRWAQYVYPWKVPARTRYSFEVSLDSPSE